MIFESGQNLKLCPLIQISFAIFFKLHLFLCFMWCSAQGIDNCHDVENVLLCWPIFKTTMLKHLLMNDVISIWFRIYCQNHHRYVSRQWLKFVLVVRVMSGKSQGTFSAIPWQPCCCIMWYFVNSRFYPYCRELGHYHSLPKNDMAGPLPVKYAGIQIARLMGPTWGPPGSCRSQISPMLAPWTLLSG